MKNTIRIVSIASYLLIILAGQMIGLPFICWLIFASFDFGSIDQLFAILGIAGVIFNLSKWRNNIPLTIVSFILMLSPVLSRLLQVPVEMFDYLAFQIPLTIFVITYLIFIIMNILERKTAYRSDLAK
jgi:hypothetical protein